MPTLPGKVALRREQTGDVSRDRAQALAQRVATAHEQTKDIVAALMNQAYEALAADKNINIAAYATLLTASITTVLASGHLVVTLTASGVEVASAGTIFFQVLVDGVIAKGVWSTVAAGAAFSVSLVVRVAVSRGPHAVVVQWKTSVNNARINASTSVEEHAHLLLQEAL